jgi:hypothetical protein
MLERLKNHVRSKLYRAGHINQRVNVLGPCQQESIFRHNRPSTKQGIL